MSGVASARLSAGWPFVYRSSHTLYAVAIHCLQTFRSACPIFTNFNAYRCVPNLESSTRWWWCVPVVLVQMYQIYVLFDQRLCLTDLSGAVQRRGGDNTVYLPYSEVARMFPQSVSHQAGGHLEISFQQETHPDTQDSNNFCEPLFFPVCSPLACVHVFTSKAIVPDLYDRPLTLSVLVHQHQAENTQGRVWAKPNVALCHSVAATSNRNTLQQITSISALFKAASQSHKVCCRLFFFLFFSSHNVLGANSVNCFSIRKPAMGTMAGVRPIPWLAAQA